MPGILYTIDDIAEEVRRQLDEENRDSVDTEKDILPSLNRARQFAFDILARKYPEPLLKYTELDLTANQREYDIPEDAFEDRIQKLETRIPAGSTGGATFQEIQRISYTNISYYESSGSTSSPLYYCIIGRKLRLVPAPSGIYEARMWYLRVPEKYALQQGRVTIVNSAQNYVVVDQAGNQLTTESDQLGSYVNIIDGQTGEIRGTLQIQSLNSNRITFRSTPTRSTVLNRTVSGSLSDIQIAQDDYISPVLGTCVSYYGESINNFLIQFAVAEVTRKLGGQADTEENILKKFEQQVERTWVRRETAMRVKKKSLNWNRPLRSWWWRRQI